MLTSHRSASRARFVALFVAVVVLCLAWWSPVSAQSALSPDFRRGAALVQSPAAPFGSPASFESLSRLRATGANWVSIVVTFHQPGVDYSTFHRRDDDPSLEGIAQMIATARGMGMRVMLQPVVLSDDGAWSGSFAPGNVLAWFRDYANMLLPYAELAQQTQVDEFCVGTEFFSLSGPDYTENWRDLIRKVRERYYGPLTYSANWGDKITPEFATIGWWDQLDHIGISAYFPLSWNDFNTEPLRQGWFSYTDPFGGTPEHMPGVVLPGTTFHWHDMIAAVRERWNKPVLFTRIGFGSYANSPGRWDVTPDPYLELSVQANAYEATFQAWKDSPWMDGIFWSPWYSDPAAGGPADNGESPQHKPAEEVLRRWYAGQ